MVKVLQALFRCSLSPGLNELDNVLKTLDTELAAIKLNPKHFNLIGCKDWSAWRKRPIGIMIVDEIIIICHYNILTFTIQ